MKFEKRAYFVGKMDHCWSYEVDGRKYTSTRMFVEERHGYAWWDAKAQRELAVWHAEGGGWAIDDVLTGCYVMGGDKTRKATVEYFEDSAYPEKMRGIDRGGSMETQAKRLAFLTHHDVDLLLEGGLIVGVRIHSVTDCGAKVEGGGRCVRFAGPMTIDQLRGEVKYKQDGTAYDHLAAEVPGSDVDDAGSLGPVTGQVVEPEPEPEDRPALQLVEDKSEGEPEPSTAKPKAETRPERFRREFGEAYDAISRIEQEYDPSHPERVTEAGVEWNDLSVITRSLTLVGEQFMAEHPRMLAKFLKWRGDMFASDREVAALGMVATRWMADQRQREQAKKAM